MAWILPSFVGVNFGDFAVVGEPAVEFVFDIGDLGIYDAVERGEADHCAEIFDPEAVVVFHRLWRWICGAGDVVDVVDVFGRFFVVVPCVTRDAEVESARFAQEDDTVIGALLPRCGWVEGVVVYIVYVARAYVRPAAGTGDETREGSRCAMRSVRRSVSCWPQPSLKMIHWTTLGWLCSQSIMLSNSVFHCCAASGGTFCPNLGMQIMSCQTNRPSRSQ